MRLSAIALPSLAAAALSTAAPAQIEVVTSTPSLADIARNVGGERVDAASIMRGPENVHNVVPKPSHMMKVRGADLFVHGGLDGEPWVPLLLKGARNRALLPGGPGNVDASRGIDLLEVPTPDQLTRAQGHIHVFGNTHYMLDPENGARVAATIRDALARADPAHAEEYRERCARYQERLDAMTADLAKQLAPWKGAAVVSYHRSFSYFLARFGLRSIAEVEPKPGIAPGPQHLQAVVEAMKGENARLVLAEKYQPIENAEWVASRVGGKAVILAHEVGSLPGVTSYEAMFRENVGRLIAAFGGSPGKDR
ncbi:MAG: zinc ABC transporter substrate-binding protein [Planctomycetota bacterium]